ncbi:Actin-related protein 6 [Orobanche hederae]
MNQAGLAECILRAVNSCHPHLRPVLYDRKGVEASSPRTTQEDPRLSVWRGGSFLASSPDFGTLCVTKAEYEELRSCRCRKRFFH